MKTRYLFSLAALALLTAACSSDEMALTPAEQPAPAKERIPFTAVIGSTATTRVLAEAENGETITAKWQKGEKIALIHGESIDTLEVSNVDATTGAATITGDIDSPTNDEAVTVVYVGHQLGCMREFVNKLKECYEASKVDRNLTAIPADIITEVIKERLGSKTAAAYTDQLFRFKGPCSFCKTAAYISGAENRDPAVFKRSLQPAFSPFAAERLLKGKRESAHHHKCHRNDMLCNRHTV